MADKFVAFDLIARANGETDRLVALSIAPARLPMIAALAALDEDSFDWLCAVIAFVTRVHTFAPAVADISLYRLRDEAESFPEK